MSLLKSLYDYYVFAENNELVDLYSTEENTLLPIYHTSKVTSKKDTVMVILKENGDFEGIEWVEENNTIIFPITEESIKRSGSTIAPHPVVDELSYLSKSISEKKYLAYIEELSKFIDFSDGEVKKVLNTIKDFIQKEDVRNTVVNRFYSEIDQKIREGKIKAEDKKNFEKN